MTYELELADGTCIRIHIDNLDAEFAFLMQKAPGDRSTWNRAVMLRRTSDE